MKLKDEIIQELYKKDTVNFRAMPLEHIINEVISKIEKRIDENIKNIEELAKEGRIRNSRAMIQLACYNNIKEMLK